MATVADKVRVLAALKLAGKPLTLSEVCTALSAENRTIQHAVKELVELKCVVRSGLLLSPAPTLDLASVVGVSPVELFAVFTAPDKDRGLVAARLVAAGATLDEIGRTFGLTRERARQLLEKWDLNTWRKSQASKNREAINLSKLNEATQVREARKGKRDQIIDTVLRLRDEEGLTQVEIAKKLGIAQSAVSYYMITYGHRAQRSKAEARALRQKAYAMFKAGAKRNEVAVALEISPSYVTMFKGEYNKLLQNT